MNKILNIVADCIPLFGGLFVVTARPAPVDLAQYLAIYLLWTIGTFIWSIVCNWISELVPSISETSYRSALRVIILFALVLLVGILMVLLHYRASVMISQIILVLLLLLALSYRFARSQKEYLMTATVILYQIIACFLSFQLIISVFDWQSVVFSIGFGLIISTLRITQLNQRLANHATILGSAIFSVLALTGALPKLYLLILGLIGIQNWVSNKNLLLRCLPATTFIAMLTALAFL